MKYLLTAITTLLLSNVAFAAGRLHSEGEEIDYLKVTADGGFQAIFKTAHENPDGCAGSDKNFYVEPAHPGKEMMLSLVLAAKMSSRKITVYVQGCDAAGPKVLTMDIL